MTTINYYDAHASEYSRKTLNADMKYPYQRFTFYLHKGERILDLGCGSGRDTIWFRKNGYIAEAVDGSAEMVKEAQKNTGVPVKQMLFSEIDMKDMYEGIFASASLLHVPYALLHDIFARIFAALKKEGVLYASFLYGDQEGMRDGRYYTDMNEERLLGLLKSDLDQWTVLELWHSHDALDRERIWFNMILRRIR